MLELRPADAVIEQATAYRAERVALRDKLSDMLGGAKTLAEAVDRLGPASPANCA